MVRKTSKNAGRWTSANGSSSMHADTARQGGQPPSSMGEVHTTWLSLLRRNLQERHISEAADNIILQSWHVSTQKWYELYNKKWTNSCCERKIIPYNNDLGAVLDFLAQLYNSGSSCSALDSARSAVSSVMLLQESTTPAGSHL